MTGQRARTWVLGFAGIAGVLAGCGKSGVQECLDLNEAQRYEEAARRCEEVYEAEGEAEAGVMAARAHYFLGHPDETLAWRDRLVKAGKAAPGVEALAAAVHQQRGEVEEAERAYRRDLALSRAAGDHRRAADNLYRLFYLRWGGASYRETYLLASASLQEAAQSQDPKVQAGAAQALFTSLYEIGDLQGAHQALETARELIDKKDPAAQANLLNSLGAVLAAEGRLALARRHFEQALEVGDGLTKEQVRAIHLNLAEVHLDLGDVERAAHHLDRAWEHLDPAQPVPAAFHYFRARVETERGRFEEAARSLAAALGGEPEPEWAWQLEYRQGLLAEARGDLPAAEAAYRRSIAVVEELRRSLGFDELKAWLLDEKRQPFEALFRIQARAGRAQEALATAEHAQARTLLDAFLHASSSTGSEAGASLQRIEGLESLLPAMSESPVATPQPLDRMLAAFGDRHGLVYFDAGDELWLIAVAGQRVRLFGPGPATEVRRLAARFLADPDDARTAERLGELLLPPGSLPVSLPRLHPDPGSTLYIVADGLLGNLPFAALRRGERYLVEDHALVSIPSLSALTVLEASGREHPRPPLVLADPQGNLPAARTEGIEVARLLGSAPRTDRSAVSAELRKASGARSLHLATHTGLGPSGAWLQLADRRVSASEIVRGRIGPRLVVLASCASGVRPGGQMWGSLGAAFLAAGSRAVLASLWSIEDEPARDLILRFYREGGASDPAAALARAQRVAIGQGLSPQQWAPFVLFGSDRPLSEALDRKGGKT
ncbi:MAG TPA: CHAT domain-containing tetratricopeptide repeat protein [Thermoanaerobaculia bacterium]|nr:CHAT domain-containing tetratricopeptide repeat protein [Thermoanaerobaculia bacterium]